MSPSLGSGKLALAMDRIRAWQADPGETVRCPACEAPGLEIADRSARPYSEWYVLTCKACGFEETIAIPLVPPSSG